MRWWIPSVRISWALAKALQCEEVPPLLLMLIKEFLPQISWTLAQVQTCKSSMTIRRRNARTTRMWKSLRKTFPRTMRLRTKLAKHFLRVWIQFSTFRTLMPLQLLQGSRVSALPPSTEPTTLSASGTLLQAPMVSLKMRWSPSKSRAPYSLEKTRVTPTFCLIKIFSNSIPRARLARGVTLNTTSKLS